MAQVSTVAASSGFRLARKTNLSSLTRLTHMCVTAVRSF
jgi:hypothetical protein